MRSGHADVIPAQCLFDIIQRVTDLRCQFFACHALYNVLVLSLRELRASTKRLPQPDW
jgi:hypothetical protein